MFISRDLVYLELQKTGSTHIRRVLKDLLGGRIIGKHNQASSNLFTEGRYFLGSIRDPWEWYTSLWAFGCDHKGALYKQVTRQGPYFKGLGWKTNFFAAFLGLLSRMTGNPKNWEDTFQDVNDPDAFRTWLYMIHDLKNFRYIGEGYGSVMFCQFAGFLTFRYVKLYCTKVEEISNLYDLSTYDQLKNYEREYCFVDRFVRNESLEVDLFSALKKFGLDVPVNKKNEVISRKKTNASSKKHGPRYYYDSISENLVSRRERLIIDKFGYIPPSTRDS